MTKKSTRKEKNSSELTSRNIEEQLNKLNNNLTLGRIFLRGVVNGIGQFIGATIGIAIIFLFINRFLAGVRQVPLLNRLTENEIVEIIEDTTNSPNETNRR